MFYEHLKSHIEAILFISGDPVPAARLADLLDIDKMNVENLIAKMQDDMNVANRGITLIKVAGGYQLCTKPELSYLLEKMTQIMETKLSAPVLETLSIIAFKQPITKQEIENIRGVRIDRVLAKLLERDLIKDVGRKNVIGKPILYGTTDQFLRCFGLDSISELPILPEIQELVALEQNEEHLSHKTME